MTENTEFESYCTLENNNLAMIESTVQLSNESVEKTNNQICIGPKISLKNRIRAVADYISFKYPLMVNEQVKVSDPRILDVCKEVLTKKNNDYKSLKKDLVKALSSKTSTLCKLLRGIKVDNIPIDSLDLMSMQEDFINNPYSTVIKIIKLQKIAKSRKNIKSMLTKCQRLYKLKNNASQSEGNCSKTLSTQLITGETDRKEVICVPPTSPTLYSDELKLTDNRTSNNENIVNVLSRCSIPHEIGYWNCTTSTDKTLNNLLQTRNVKRKLDFENYSFVSKTLKQTFETSDSEGGIFELDLTMDYSSNCLLPESSDYIGKTNTSLVVENCNVLTSTPNRIDIDISPQQAFGITPQKMNLSYSSIIYNTDTNFSPFKSSTTIFNEIINIVTPVKITGVTVACSTPDANAKALPKNSVNIFPCTIRCDLENKKAKRFNFGHLFASEGKFELSNYELNKIDKVSTDVRNMILREKFVNVNNSCVLSIKNINKNKCGEITSIYGYCRHPTCKNFKFEFQKMESAVKVHVYSNQIHYSHGGKLTNFLRGTERMSYRKEAVHVKPLALRQKHILKSSPSRLKRGHLQKIRSNSVYNRVSHERLSEFDFNSDDRLDMELMALKHPEFVRYVSHPDNRNFECYVFSKEQLAVLNKLKPITLHVDATGTVIRNTTLKKKQEKRMLYYAAVVKANGRMMPVAEFISTNQTTTAISKWLSAFKRFAEEHGFELSDLIKNVTSDFSTAIIKSLAQSFNGCVDVIDYLNQCFDHLYGHKEMQSKIIINLCCCHLVKNIADDVSKYYGAARKTNKNKDLARIIVGLVTPAFDIKTVNELNKWFEALCTVILSPDHNKGVQKCIDYLIQLNNCKTAIHFDEYKDNENILLNSDSMHDLKTNPFTKSKYKASKFYGYFKIMSENIRLSFTSTDKTAPNPFYNEEYFSDLMGSVIPVIPMWTCLMLYSRLNECQRPNNSGAELWFHYLKGKSLQAKGMKCSRFIRLTREHIESVTKEVLCDIPNKRCAIPKQQNFDCNIVQKNKSVLSVDSVAGLSDDEDVEHWQPRKNKKIGYFKQGSLMANMKKFKPIHKKPEIEKDLIAINDGNNFITQHNMVTPIVIKTDKTFTTPGSYCSPIDKTPLKYDTYSNRLKKDVNFYRQIIRNNVNREKIEYTVGIYKHVENIVSYSDILFSDFDTLSDYRSESPYMYTKMWLSNFVISIILASYSIRYTKKSNTQVFSSDLVDAIIEKHKYYKEKVTIKENSFLIMPWNVGGSHWIIAFVDFCTKECLIMDPMGQGINEQERFNKLMKGLKTYCSYGEHRWFPKLNLSTHKLQNIPQQEDSYNCGVYVIYYAITLMNGDCFDKFFDPMRYRQYLKTYLLENSDFMRDICFYCGRNAYSHRVMCGKKGVEWVECMDCRRWMVIHCIPDEDKLDTTADYEQSEFKCLLCQEKH